MDDKSNNNRVSHDGPNNKIHDNFTNYFQEFAQHLHNELRAANSRMRKVYDENQKVQMQTTEKIELIEALQNEIMRKDEIIQTQKTNYSKLEEAFKAQQLESAGFLQKYVTLEVTYDEDRYIADQKIQKLENDLKEKENTIEQFRQQETELNEKLTKHVEDLAEKEKIITELKEQAEQNEKTETQLKTNLKKVCEMIKEQTDKHESQIAALKDELQEKDKIIEQCRSDFNKLEQEKSFCLRQVEVSYSNSKSKMSNKSTLTPIHSPQLFSPIPMEQQNKEAPALLQPPATSQRAIQDDAIRQPLSKLINIGNVPNDNLNNRSLRKRKLSASTERSDINYTEDTSSDDESIIDRNFINKLVNELAETENFEESLNAEYISDSDEQKFKRPKRIESKRKLSN